jgi:hypothetical protein
MKRFALLALVLASPAWAQAPVSLPVTGMVNHAGPVSLSTMKPVTVTASFHTMHGEDSHSWTGPLLLDVLNTAGIEDAPGKKTHFLHVIMAHGSDGYTVAVAIGEIDPRGEGKQIIIALQQDGQALKTPHLIVPRDNAFARGVRDLAGIEVR